MPQPSHFCWHFDFYFMSVWYLRMNRCKFRRRSKGLQVGNYYPIILFKLGLQVIRPCSCHRICTTFCVINNFIAIKNIDLILSFTGMHTLWSSHKYDNFYNLHQQHKVFSRLSDWMWYLFYDIFQKLCVLWKTTLRNVFTFLENIVCRRANIFITGSNGIVSKTH